jgi:sodium/potassium-transporting ATPase subunit alpha
MHNMDPQTARDEMHHYGNRVSEGNSSNAIAQLRSIAGLCNASEFDAATNDLPLHERRINGDATDQAILRFSESLGPVSELRQVWKKTFELAFNSKNKYMIRTLELVQEKGLELALSSTEAASFRPEDTYVLRSLKISGC